MTKEKNDKIAWVSGETCEIPGTFFTNCCDIRFELNFEAGNIFVRCPSCRKKVKWQRLKAEA